MSTLDIIAIIALTIMGISFLIFTIALTPILLEIYKLLVSVRSMTETVEKKIMPNAVRASEFVEKAGQLQVNLGQSVRKSFLAVTEGVKVGLNSYKSAISKKQP